jgi:(R)-amidase
MTSVRIAAVQQEGNPGKPDQNREKALGFADEALSRGADIVLFHEEMLLGCIDNVRELAEPLDGPTTRAFQKLLRGSPAQIVYGLTESEGESIYIAAPVVTSHGVVANYRKTHLWWCATGSRHEPSYYSAGDRLVTFDARGHRCGIMICYDGDFPEMTRSYANLGCGVVLWLNNRESRGPNEVRPLARANSMIIAATCCCGPDEGQRHCDGGTNITNYDGKPLAEIWDREGVILADVDPEAAIGARAENPWYRGARPELYFYPPPGPQPADAP